MNTERVIRAAAKPLLSKLVQPLDKEDLYQVGRIALWQAGELPPAWQTVIARNAMRDELRRHRWIGRSKNSPMQEMPSYDEWDSVPEGSTDCHAASLVAVRQFIESLHKLTDGQRRVLHCLASGMDQSECAREMGVTPSRVCQHVAALREVVARYV